MWIWKWATWDLCYKINLRQKIQVTNENLSQQISFPEIAVRWNVEGKILIWPTRVRDQTSVMYLTRYPQSWHGSDSESSLQAWYIDFQLISLEASLQPIFIIHPIKLLSPAYTIMFCRENIRVDYEFRHFSALLLMYLFIFGSLSLLVMLANCNVSWWTYPPDSWFLN